MEKGIDRVMPAGIGPKKLAVELVGKPGERMPLARAVQREGPGDVPERQPTEDVFVVVDIVTVIEVDELKEAHLGIEAKRDQRQQGRQEDSPPTLCPTAFSPFRQRPYPSSVACA